LRQTIGLRLHTILLVVAGLVPTLGITAYLLARQGGLVEAIVLPAALFAIGLCLAWAISSRTAAAVASIRDAAVALGRGEAMPPVKVTVREVAEVAAALGVAEARLAARTAEHAESEKRFQDFATASSDWFWEMAPDLATVKVIARGGARFSAEEAARRSFNWIQEIRDEARREFLVNRLKEHRAFRDFTMEFRDKGKTRYIKISGVPYFGRTGEFLGYRGTGSDITAEREQAEEVRLVEQRFMQALENINEGFALFNAEERLIACNERYRRMHLRGGTDEASEPLQIGMTVLEIFGLRTRNGLYAVPDGQSVEEFAQSKLANFRSFREHWYWQTADNRWIHIGHARTADGGSVSLWTDMTDLKAAEDHRQRLESQLQHSQKLEALGTLAGGVAHDLNNVLVPIMALTKLTAARMPEGSPQRRNLERVVAASHRAKGLVQQILAFSRKEEAAKQEVDLAAILHEALSMLRASIPATIRIVEAVEAVPAVYGDPGQLHQVIINLVTNAAQAIAGGTGTIALALKPAPSPGDGRPDVLLEVADDGCGMEEAVRSRIFDPFFTTKPVGEGTGLGLSVVHGIVTAHGGAIEVVSRIGEGSRFCVRFPSFVAALADKQLAEKALPRNVRG
jgi:signal transduction histidine kinase